MDVAAGLVGLLLGALVGPLADRIATNAPKHDPLLRGAPRSPRLPLVTAATALLGGASGLVFGFELEALIAALFCWALVVVTRTDLEHRLIPDRVVIPGTIAMVALRTIDDPSAEWMISAVVTGLVFFVIVLVYPKGLGMGDVKLSAFLGAGLGVAVLPAMFFAFFAAFVPSAVMLVRHGKDARKMAIPFGPFLALGGIVGLFWGDAILDWYRSLSS